MFKCKISTADITYGPTDPDDVAAFATAGELMTLGYRRTSNAYCLVSRIDTPDWLEIMARSRHCSVADFYNADGTGISDRHRDHYVRVYSKDNLTVHPKVLKLIKGY